jgi:hypothetical protein
MTEYLSAEGIEKILLEHQLLREADHNQMIGPLLPTLRWGVPGFAGFRCPAGVPSGTVSPPDRWWAFDAVRGDVVAYALTSAVPFAPGLPADDITLPPPPRASRAAALADGKRLQELIDRAVPSFFAGQAGDPELRRDLAAALPLVIPAPMMPWFRGLVPDFLDWLGRP